jgi:hypothetical protein
MTFVILIYDNIDFSGRSMKTLNSLFEIGGDRQREKVLSLFNVQPVLVNKPERVGI